MLEWIFEGIGTEIISLLVGALMGGGIGYKIGVKKVFRQKQIARDNANQTQVGEIRHE